MTAASGPSGAAPRHWAWRAAPTPAAPAAVVALDAAAHALLARAARLPSALRESMTVVAAPGWAVILGPADSLPWTDGVRYAAPSAASASLWLPTTLEPDLPHELIAAALHRQHGAEPLLLWPDPAVVLPLGGAAPATDAVLAAAATMLRRPA